MTKVAPTAKMDQAGRKHVDALGADHESIQVEPIRLKPSEGLYAVPKQPSPTKIARLGSAVRDFVLGK